MPRFPLAAVALCLLSPSVSSLYAAPILITSGTISGPNGGPVAIEVYGEQFSLKGGGSPSGGWWAVGECDDQCFPGETYPLDFGWAGLDFPAVGVINGETYQFGSASEEYGSANIFAQGSFVAPFFTGSETATVVAPFTLFGSVYAPWPSGAPEPLFSPIEFFGAGIATINLQWFTTARPEGGWLTTSASYEITPSPVPEPATLSLLALGLAGLTARRWKQRRRSPSSGNTNV